MGKHFNSRMDDAAWRVLFGRWHGGETAKALRAEAGVSPDTWRANAKRLGMRIGDLPADHPARRSIPVLERPDDWRHPNSKLTAGQWREVFALVDRGATYRDIEARFPVRASNVASMAGKLGLQKRQRALAEGEPLLGNGSPDPEGATWGVTVDPADPEGTRAAFWRLIQRAAGEGRFAVMGRILMAKEQVERVFDRERVRAGASIPGGYRPAGYLSPQTPTMPGGYRPSGYMSPQTPGLLEGGDGDGQGNGGLVLREAQRPPEGAWSTWLFLGGRGAGKTLAGASWIADMAERLGPGGRLALIGPTLHDVREVMIAGPSGVMSLPRWTDVGGDGEVEWRGPEYQPSRRRLVFPNGAEAFVFSAEDPDSLRGPQFAAAWADEFCAWRNGGETLALLRMGLRLRLPDPDSPAVDPSAAQNGGVGAQGARLREPSDSPRLVVTTTPRPTRALKALRAEELCALTHATTRDNGDHLAPGFLEGLERLYGGTRRAAQELEGQVVEPEGGLFTAEMMAAARGAAPVSVEGRPVYERVVVGLDPTCSRGGDACGIVAVGRRGETAWVLADRSMRGLSPQKWAERAMETARLFGARCIVGEVNQGGDMVEAVLKAAGCGADGENIGFTAVRASRGKAARAEPVAALYEQGRVRHAGAFAALEEELMELGAEEEGEAAGHWDRADALVWAVTDLMLDGRGEGPRVRAL
ncbi:terminase large subunit domain-containing protein [Brevundimonas mediterranea]|uniref:Phage terminase large subunit-like protein n=1 Tax=Brevundimonas mediterranea TaxID=74329 RepID=A0A7W6F022_9CAUL|nr:terminase family protein [Brevundimonas mediterranea]MBB3872621.1 phage terminase large subunit-like protein [Brevundimonas mediterranea]